jgi:hypothetical protein
LRRRSFVSMIGVIVFPSAIGNGAAPNRCGGAYTCTSTPRTPMGCLCFQIGPASQPAINPTTIMATRNKRNKILFFLRLNVSQKSSCMSSFKRYFMLWRDREWLYEERSVMPDQWMMPSFLSSANTSGRKAASRS